MNVATKDPAISNHHGHQEALGIVGTRQQEASDEAGEKTYERDPDDARHVVLSKIRLKQTELGLDFAFLAQRRLRPVGWLNALRLVHGLL